MSSILSTKILTPSQKELLLNVNQSFAEYDAIKIEFLDFEIKGDFNYYIFTSQNGVKAFLRKITNSKAILNKAFCVGEKTQSILEENGMTVVETAPNSKELANIITEKYQNEMFLLFSGNLRRKELPEELKKNNVWYKEITAYQTHMYKKRFERNFDGVLFFSPSGVESFVLDNTIKNSTAFCIGETTALEAKKYTDKIITASRPTVENVLVKAIKHFRIND